MRLVKMSCSDSGPKGKCGSGMVRRILCSTRDFLCGHLKGMCSFLMSNWEQNDCSDRNAMCYMCKHFVLYFNEATLNSYYLICIWKCEEKPGFTLIYSKEASKMMSYMFKATWKGKCWNTDSTTIGKERRNSYWKKKKKRSHDDRLTKPTEA